MKSFCFALLFGISLPSVGFAALTQISGNQTDGTVKIEKGPVVTLKGTYTVPAGKKLELAPGAQINAEKGSKIVVAGELVISADEKTPAFVRGRNWEGFVVKESGTATISGLQITGAVVALEVNGKMPVLKNSVFAKNISGVLLQGGAHSEIDNNLFTQHAEYAIMISGQGAGIKNCSFVKNKGFGAQMNQSSPVFEKCFFSENDKAGIYAMETSTSGKQCSFGERGIALQSGVSHGELRFPECYWGAKSTSLMKAKGTDTTLPNVKDAHTGNGSIKVYMKNFLSAPPKPCGATVTNKL